jgi:hypothetical protein
VRKKIGRRSAIAVTLVASLAWTGSADLISAQSVVAGQRMLFDALAQISGRSPGDRTSAILTKVTNERTEQRSARALPRIRTKPKGGSDESASPLPLVAIPLADELTRLRRTSTYADAAVPGLPSGGAPAFGSFPSLPGGGGGIVGGSGSGPGNSPPVAGTQPAPTVPEPATWATFILGFGLLGIALRRRALEGRKLG